MAVRKIDDLKPIYLIYGKDEFLLEAAVRRLRSMFEAADPSLMDVDVFDGKQVRGEEVVAAANTLPFMGSRRLVLVRNIDQMPASEHPPIVEYVANPAATTCLVLAGSGLAKNTRLYKALETAGALAEYAAPKRRELASWVAKAVSEKGRRIERDAAEALVAATGGDLRTMDAEIVKLVAYIGDRDTIERADVAAVVTTVVPPIWTFLDALGARDAQGALGSARALMLAGESPLGLLAAATRRMRQLVSAKALVERGGSDGLARELGLQEWQGRRLAQDAARFHEPELADALRAAADAEARMKTSRGDAGLVLERWVLRVCVPSDGSAARNG
ncbi:DNA polymerase III subunit delta [Coriobacteriia bacterium Es71-Z0120]|uniref:DNA polymerase III subunit delta n=1 Tax=Parvivirga hydrogeniphila TaxID=2939460 RepID=UPI002260FF14|nr:DNA polymerase III subunit delta [Parvivirga hydrogeniphila]MCL4078984.1 DNA polymerase III subunit delta [Parvivirga hydrogeniphila]